MFSNFIPPWTFFSPTLDKIITRSISYLPTVYIYFLRRSPFLLSVAGQFSDPLARDQVQTSERSQAAISLALGDIPHTLYLLHPPLTYLLGPPWHVPLSPPLFTGALHLRLARDSSCAVQFELTLFNTSCTLCRRACEGLHRNLWGGRRFISLPNSWSQRKLRFFSVLFTFVFCLVLTRRAIASSALSHYFASSWTIIRRDKNQLNAQVDSQSLLWVADIAIHGTPENQVLSRCECAAAGE